jgi:hypothetical protein
LSGKHERLGLSAPSVSSAGTNRNKSHRTGLTVQHSLHSRALADARDFRLPLRRPFSLHVSVFARARSFGCWSPLPLARPFTSFHLRSLSPARAAIPLDVARGGLKRYREAIRLGLSPESNRRSFGSAFASSERWTKKSREWNKSR